MSEDIEIKEIRDFLGNILPFSNLDQDCLSRAANGLRIAYYGKGQGQINIDYDNPQLYIVRTGAFEVRDKDGNLLDRLGEGDFFGFPSLLTGENVHNKVQVLEDGLVYLLDLELFQYLRNQSREFDRFFNRAHAERQRRFSEASKKDNQLTIPIDSLLRHEIVSMAPERTVGEAARLMKEQRVSSLLVLENGALVGILTDRDLRSRVLAEGLDGSVPIAEVMTREPCCVERSAMLFEASMLMSQHNIHHLPVLDGKQAVGMITSTDLIRTQNNQPILLIGEINRQQDLDGLVAISKRLPELLRSLMAADARADEVGRILSLISDSLTCQLLKLGESKFGPAPFDYTWLAFGSQGRMDQTAGSDQDNALLLARAPNEEEAAYFKALAEYVCHGLDACGYMYCPGGIMAQTDQWRQPLEVWQGYFDRWIDTPTPKSLLNASIFFDMRALTGSTELFEQLQNRILSKTKDAQIFIACLAGNALKSSPPLGFFNKFVLERDGEQNKVLDLKHRGVAIVNDIARIYALAEGIKEVNTQQRLEKLRELKLLNRKDARNLADAHEYIAHMRLKNQGEQLSAGKQANNYLKPSDISSLLRHQLRDAFEAVHGAQNGIQHKFARGLF